MSMLSRAPSCEVFLRFLPSADRLRRPCPAPPHPFPPRGSSTSPPDRRGAPGIFRFTMFATTGLAGSSDRVSHGTEQPSSTRAPQDARKCRSYTVADSRGVAALVFANLLRGKGFGYTKLRLRAMWRRRGRKNLTKSKSGSARAWPRHATAAVSKYYWLVLT